jgi:AraC-like DNA-binding protein
MVVVVEDPLSDVLRSVRLGGGVFLDVLLTEPWCVASEITAEDCKPFLRAPVQVIAYHFVVAGRMLCFVGDGPPTEVRAGEIVLLPRNDPHLLASEPGLEPVRGHHLVQPSPDGGLARIRHGGGGEPTQLVCGFLGSDDARDPLIASLPPVLKLDVRQGASGDWIEASVRFAAKELAAGRLATSGVLSRLSELLLAEAVREYAATLPVGAAGWLKGVADPQVGRALALMHGGIAAPWSAEALAREVAMSRSAFVDRFTTVVGVPPIRYLTAWRLRTAKLRLRESAQSVAQLAHAVGYESAEAFSRAFKREFGFSPAQWRDRDAGH